MLKRIPLRIIWRNKSQFLGIIFLVFLASLAFVAYSTLIKNINANYEKFVSKGNQEDFHFVTVKPIDEEEIARKYGLEVEEKFSWNYDFDGKTIRFFSISERVNIPFVSDGKMPSRGEVCINVNFAQANGYKVGDEIDIKGEKFRISGYAYLPDYVYITKNDQDILPDHKHFGVGIMNRSDLRKFMPAPQFHYYMANMAKRGEDLSKLQEELNARYGLLGFQESWDNLRIVTTEKKMQAAEPTSYVLSGTILIISSILLFIVLRRLIASMHAEIGTLNALGYSQREIIATYLRFPVFIWVFGSAPGCVAGYFLAEPLIRFYASYFSIPMVEKIVSYSGLAIAALLPAFFMFASAYLALRSLLRRSVVEIIRGEGEKAFGKRFRMTFLDGFPFKTRLTAKQGLLHPSRELVLVIGVAFSAFLLLYAVSARSAFSDIIDKTYKEVFIYDYTYVLNSFQSENSFPSAERFNTMPFVINGEKSKMSIVGLEKDSKLVVIEDKGGRRLKLDGLIISRSLADKFNLKEGDTLRLKSQVTGKEYSLKIKAVAGIYVGNNGYMNLDEFNRTFGYEKGTFIGLFSKKPLDIPKERLLTSMDKQYMIDSFEASADTINQTLQFLGFISFLLALTIVYVLSSLTISENRKPLALFKILGYRDRELSSIFLGFNNVSFVIGFLLGIPLFNYFVNYMFNQMLKDVDFSLEMTVGLEETLIAFALLLLVFVFSKYLGRRRIYRISPAAILKEQME